MWQKGSITVFYSLILTLILSLISSFLLSAKVSAGRAQIAMAMDQAMFSAMARYDKALLEEYHLFFQDGGLGSQTLQMGKILDELESDMAYGLSPSKEKTFLAAIDFLNLSLENSAITGYTLATDQKGGVFREQVIQYMQDTAVLQGISSLTESLANSDNGLLKQILGNWGSFGVSNQNDFNESNSSQNSFNQSSSGQNTSGVGTVFEQLERLTDGFSIEELEQRVAEINSNSANAGSQTSQASGNYNSTSNGTNGNVSSESQTSGNHNSTSEGTTENTNSGDAQTSNLTKEEKAKVEDAKAVLKSVEKLKSTSILKLVIKSPENLSDWQAERAALVSNRNRQSGMGVVETVVETDSLIASYLFQDYLLQNINHYGQQFHATGPAYGLEYILGGKNSDVANLENVVKKLLLMREVANTVYLYSDSAKRTSVESVAALFSAAILLPELQPVIEAALILAWAYVESLVDVRGLLSGKAVPLWKNMTSWQVDMENLLTAVSNPDACTKSSGNLYYQEYLALLLLTTSEETKTIRCMDVIEQTMRGISGKENFSMDCAIDTLEIQMSVTAEQKKTFEIIEKRSYRAM